MRLRPALNGGVLLAFALLSAVALGDTIVPASARANFDKAEIAREEGRLEEAAALYRTAIEAHPGYLEAHAGFLAALRGHGDLSSAAAVYAAALAKKPDSVDLKVFQAAALEPAAAIKALSELAASNSDNYRAYAELARAHLANGDPKAAERALKEALKLDSADSLGRVLLADAFLAAGKVSRAVKEYRDIVRADPAYVPAKLRLALAMHRDEKSDDAIEQLSAIVADDNLPRLVAAHWLLAVIRADLGKYDEAIQAIDRVLAIDKDDFDATIAKGELFLRANRPSEAAKVFAKAAETHPRSGLVYFCLGWAHERSSDSPEIQDAQRKERLVAAAEAYDKCTTLDPGVRPRDSLGFVYLLGEKHGDAITQFRRAKDIDPEFAAAVNNLGLAQDMADNRAEAKKRYQFVLSKIDKLNVRAHVMLALDLWLDGSASKAIKELNKALKIAPEDDLAWTFLGDIHHDNKKTSSAIKAYKRAVEINDKNFIAWYHLGIVYDEKRRDEDADRCYRKALEAKPDPPVELVLRLAEINEVELLDRPKEALKFYQLYVDLGGTADWVPERIEELKELIAGK